MNETRSVKKILEGKLEGRRSRGRPRLRWINDVEDGTRCEMMENKSIGKGGMGINYKGSQGQTKRAVALQEEEVYH
jgi:hypothetical protein